MINAPRSPSKESSRKQWWTSSSICAADTRNKRCCTSDDCESNVAQSGYHFAKANLLMNDLPSSSKEASNLLVMQANLHAVHDIRVTTSSSSFGCDRVTE